jgi:hypothetical protein
MVEGHEGHVVVDVTSQGRRDWVVVTRETNAGAAEENGRYLAQFIGGGGEEVSCRVALEGALHERHPRPT